MLVEKYKIFLNKSVLRNLRKKFLANSKNQKKHKYIPT